MEMGEHAALAVCSSISTYLNAGASQWNPCSEACKDRGAASPGLPVPLSLGTLRQSQLQSLVAGWSAVCLSVGALQYVKMEDQAISGPVSNIYPSSHCFQVLCATFFWVFLLCSYPSSRFPPTLQVCSGLQSLTCNAYGLWRHKEICPCASKPHEDAAQVLSSDDKNVIYMFT